MKYEEALTAKQMIEAALKKYGEIKNLHIYETVSIKEEKLKKFGVFTTKNYSLVINADKSSLGLLSPITSLEDAQKVLDKLNQLCVQTLSNKIKNIVFDSNAPTPDFNAIFNEYQQIQNQKEEYANESVVGDNIPAQNFFHSMRSLVKKDINLILNGDDHDGVRPAFFLTKEGAEAFLKICNWKFDLGAISIVENYVKEVETERLISMAEKHEINKLISYYLKIRENLLLSQEKIYGIIKTPQNLLADFENTINQAKEILKGINEENKTVDFKNNVEPYVEACAQAIEITRTRIITVTNMLRMTSEYLSSQELRDLLSAEILSKGNEYHKKYFNICEQIAENGGSFNIISSSSQAFDPRDRMTNLHLDSIEEARLYMGRVVSVYDQTIAGENFYPVRDKSEKDHRDNVYNQYDRGYDSNGQQNEVLERHKRQCAWYSGSDGSTYLWLKGVGFIIIETEKLLTPEEFQKLEEKNIKITLAQGLDYFKEEIRHPRMKDGSPYLSVYDFESHLSNLSFFRGVEVLPNKQVLYKIMKENGMIPTYFSKQAIMYLDSKFDYSVSKEEESEISTEEFNEFDPHQKVKDISYATEKSEVVTSEPLNQENIEEVKDRIKASLAKKIEKASLTGLESLAVTKEDLDIMPEIVAMTQIIATEQGIDIEVEANAIEGNVKAVANYDRNKIVFNLNALRNLDGFHIDVTRLEKGDIMRSAMKIIRLIQTMLHEIKHFEQKKRIDTIGSSECDMETFKEAVENEIVKTGAGKDYYARAHDNFLSEINADIYGWENCIKYFKEYFAVKQVPAQVVEHRDSELARLAEKKQPVTNSIVAGNGCLSTYLNNYGHKEYRETGKLVAEQFSEIIQNIQNKMKNGCDFHTEEALKAMMGKCKQIISEHEMSTNE